jgi:arylsulfatase A-like enzyme
MTWSKEERATLEAQQRHYGGTVEAFYRYADEWLGRLLALRGPDTGILLLSDHGFEPEADSNRTGNHLSAPPGIFVVAGPGIRPGRRDGGATLYDVMPTLAAALGLPVADDLEGAPQASWFIPEAWSGLAIRRVAKYDTRGRYVPDIPSPDATEKELIDQLKAIGYIK